MELTEMTEHAMLLTRLVVLRMEHLGIGGRKAEDILRVTHGVFWQGERRKASEAFLPCPVFGSQSFDRRTLRGTHPALPECPSHALRTDRKRPARMAGGSGAVVGEVYEKMSVQMLL